MTPIRKSQSVKVFIRVRPPLTTTATAVTSGDSLQATWNFTKKFHFDKVFDATATQLEIYQTVAAPLVDKALNGYNGTILAYGQSGTGKTFTVFGEIANPPLRGIIPNVFSHILAQISLAPPNTSYLITVTFLEIYNEELRDLLSNSPSKLEIRENPKLGVYVTNLSGVTVESIEQVLNILQEAARNRAQGSTSLNVNSSRSHAIFGVHLQAKHEDGSTTFGKLNLVDLAGSERVSKSLATGDRLKEAVKINLSLSVLGNVISALVDGCSTYIPYRNSKLTRLLQDSLGGNCLTSMIATVRCEREHQEETYYTLMYAQRAAKIQNCLIRNLKPSSNLLEEFESKLEKLRGQLEELQVKPQRVSSLRKKQREISLRATEQQKKILQDKISVLQRKVLLGGERLLQKAELQLELLQYNSNQLKLLDSSHQLLQDTLQTKKLEQESFARKSLSLQEEDALLDFQIRETERRICKAEKLCSVKESEYQNEIGILLYTNKMMARDLALANYVLDKTVDVGHLEVIRRSLVWDEQSAEYRLKSVAHCGNNLKKISLDIGTGAPVRSLIKERYRKY